MSAAVSPTDLLAELASLRTRVDALERKPVGVRIRTLQQDAFAGLPVDVIVTVADARGLTMTGQPVVVSASWGRLRLTEGTEIQEGTGVTAVSGADGSVRLSFLPPSSEALLPSQQDALQSILQVLDAGAAKPADARPGLDELARQYRWEANRDFRDAVDVYTHDLHPRFLDTIVATDYLAEWLSLSSTIFACVLDSADPASGQVVATAAMRVRLRDWLGAWLQVFVETATGSNPLPDEFTQVAQIGKSGAGVVNGVYGRVREFTAEQRGAVGDYAGRRVVAAGVRQFIESGAGNLPDEVRVSVTPAVGVASDVIATAGTALVDAVASTRADLTKFQQTATDQISAKADVSALAAKADIAAVDALSSAVQTKADAAAFQTFQSQITATLDRKVDATIFDSFRTDITKQIGNRLTRADLEAIQTQLNAISVTQANITTQLGNKVDLTTFTGFQTQTNNTLRNKVNVTTFNNLSTSVQTMLTRLGPIG